MATRFLYDQLITSASMITASSTKKGVVTSALKDGTGGAAITTSGDYTGTTDLEYIIEIDSVAGGAAIGQATFKWSDGGGTWDATGVTTDTAYITLNNGVKIKWTSTGGTDFVLADKWYFKALAPFGVHKMIDWDPDHRYRSNSLDGPNTITIDLGSAQTVQACAIWFHNFTSAATITINGNSADAWGAPAFSEAVTWADCCILHYLSSSQSYRYWRLSVSDAANPDGYIEISEFFLGPYAELTRGPRMEYGHDYSFLRSVNTTPYGVRKERYYNRRETYNLSFTLPATDLGVIDTMVDALVDRGAGTFQPCYFNLASTDTGASMMCFIPDLSRWYIIDGWMSVEMTLDQLVHSV